MGDLDDFYVHTVTVEPYLGATSSGPQYGPGVAVAGFLDTTTVLAPTAGGQEATAASSMFYTPPENAPLFPVQSRVTSADLGGDGKAVVVKVNALTSGPLDLPDHVEVGLL